MATSTSTAATPDTQKDEQMLNIGTQCADPLCRLVDFLPFKCQHCSKSFCQEHFKVEAHHCPEYDEFKHNRVAPDCPFCHTPVAIPPGQDPNVWLEQHFEKECSVLTGREKTKSTPVCARGTCKKVLFSPIRCDTCRRQFCPAHRFPSDHSCKPPQSRLLNNSSSSSSTSAAKRPAVRPALSTSASNTAKQLNTKANAAAANVKKSVASAAASSSKVAAKVSAAAGPAMVQQKKTDRVSVSSSLTNATTATTPTIPNPHNESPTGPTPVIPSFIPRSLFAAA